MTTHDITCPHCHKTFSLDNAGYADIAKQVRDKEFFKQLHEKLEAAAQEERLAAEKARFIQEQEMNRTLHERDTEIQTLKSQLERHESDRQAAARLAEAEGKAQLQEALQAKERDIQALQAKLSANAVENELAITKAVDAVQKERDALQSTLKEAELRNSIAANQLKERYELQLKDRDDHIERLKDMKARLSTKMVGETLEQHCEVEFNRTRAMAFPRAYFEKDNDARSGSKGDYIFRDTDESGTEIISIMFEMKNENDSTATKKKNEDFLKELDKDRTEKKCEYAVLVSLLEPESELYNTGIVDVSHRYPKMYVIRPQFFLQIISLLRNASTKALAYKRELELTRQQNIDVTNFEEKLETFKNGFSRNYDLAHKQFNAAVEEIDKSISHLQKIKDNLLKSDNNLRLANDKAQDVTIKRLTRGNATMKAKFEALDAPETKKP
ncbi:hypothetical protein AL01_03085 [Bombella intestini]|uniref:DUF2130 domain-containing protein n=1 Tax=Bombella intestini TaxID=1539051 RepID=A0A1S8GS99_9PROT|nr:DUF2130 domain-containing protein [Bombella intestini]OOL19937.1 hypothetical protein AL01_03085 [Bombella intestini]